MKTGVKITLVCKDIANYKLDKNITKTYIPKDGDVAIFEILEVGKHFTVQSESKRNVQIIEGDLIMAAFANRYATEQFEGYVPKRPTEILDILGAGGAIGILKSKNDTFKHIEPTKIKLIGYAVDDTGKVINTKHNKLSRIPFKGHVPNDAKIILSVGSCMDSGKTTSAAFLGRGLKTTGKKVAYIKLTGTAYTKDKDFAYDCGVDVAIDFTDAGFPSTYMCEKQEILDLYQTLLYQLEKEKPDYIIIEIADGLFQRETEFLLRDQEFMNTIHQVMFSTGDSLAAFYGIDFLGQLGITPVAISGRFTMSPLLVQEVKNRSNIPILTIEELMSGEFIKYFENKGVLLKRAAN